MNKEINLIYGRYHNEDCIYLGFEYQYPDSLNQEDCGCKIEE